MATPLESPGGKSRVVALLHCADLALAHKYFLCFWQVVFFRFIDTILA